MRRVTDGRRAGLGTTNREHSWRFAVPLGLARVGRSASFVAIATLAACSNANPSGPGDARLGRARGPSGLEQRITTTVEAPPPGSPYTALLTATSTLTNTGSASAHLTSRVCLFLDGDVASSAQLDRFEPLISCAAVSAEGDLAPGQSTSLTVQFGVRSGPGAYSLTLRHSLNPDFRAEAPFRVP
jgi:hypothetical protein